MEKPEESARSQWRAGRAAVCRHKYPRRAWRRNLQLYALGGYGIVDYVVILDCVGVGVGLCERDMADSRPVDQKTSARPGKLPRELVATLPINPFILRAYDDQTINVSAREKAESFASINSKLGVVQEWALASLQVRCKDFLDRSARTAKDLQTEIARLEPFQVIARSQEKTEEFVRFTTEAFHRAFS